MTLAALIGALLPDLSLYLLAGWHLIILETPPQVVFDQLYFSEAWQGLFAVDNSFVLWGVGLALAVWRRSGWAIALTGAALLHLAFDFPLHNYDARMHFWPLSTWRFESPISYWEGARGGDVVGLIEALLVALLTILLVWRFRASLWKWVFLGIGSLQVAPFFIWRLMF